MKEQHTHIHLSRQECISFDTMQAYLRNQLSREEIRRVEEHLASCEFCSDALDGFLEAENLTHHFERVAFLQKKISEKSKEKRITPRNTKKIWLYSAIAASVALLFSVSFLFKPSAENKLADNISHSEEAGEELLVDTPLMVVSTALDTNALAENLTKVEPEESEILQPATKPENREEAKEETGENPRTSTNEVLIDPEEAIAEEITSNLEVYKPEATRTLSSSKKETQNSAGSLNNSQNLLTLLSEKMAQKDYSSALNILYQLENGPDAAKHKQIIVLTRARVLAGQYNKSMGLQYLQSVNDQHILGSPEYKALLDSLSK